MERLEASDEFTLDITVGDPQKVGELMWPCWAMMCHVIECMPSDRRRNGCLYDVPSHHEGTPIAIVCCVDV